MHEHLPQVPAELTARLGAAAQECGVGSDVLLRAAQLKVAAVVTGTPALVAGEDTWRDLIGRVGTEPGRAEAGRAWDGLTELEHVAPQRVAAYLATALERLAANPDEPHYLRSLLSAGEIDAQLDRCAGPVRDLPNRRFHELFEDRVARHPDVIAAVLGEKRWTYRELNERANRIAWSLLRAGVQSEDVVAIVAERTLEWLASVIAVLKAGGCYLPLEPHFPADRIATVLTRSEARFVLADRGAPHLAEAVAVRPVTVCWVDELLAGGEPEHNPNIPVGADQLAYIYFTSGSTGEPKGAMCEHSGFLNHLFAKIEDLRIGEGEIVAQTAPQCFDISLWQLVAALLVGGRTHIIEQEVILDVRRFVETIASAGVHVAQLVPSYLDIVLSTVAEHPIGLPALHSVSVTGEALKKELVQRWFDVFPGVLLVNSYGTTETSDDSNHEVLDRVPEHHSVPLGAPIRNIRVYVLDDRGELAPVGVRGEIAFAGVCVGRGYINDETRTKAAFGADPYRPGERMYRTGDFGRWLPSGILEYLGRRDSQIKINGLRIEIGEIENRLLQVRDVRDGAIVIAGSEQRPQLVGYYTGFPAPAASDVAAALGETLPAYMVPQRLYHLPELPLTPNGKIDKKALARLAAIEQATFTAPASDTERRVAGLWSKVLNVGVDRIGRDSCFSELGGTSLSAIRLVIALDAAVTVTELADRPTVADVAALLDRKAERTSA